MENKISMEFQSSSTIIEQCQISPPPDSVLPVSIPLTIFDVGWLPLSPVQRLFFFEHQCSKDQFTNTILPNIKHSLSLALQHFFPLAGNLTWPQDSSKPEIHCVDGDYVSFTVAESDYDFDVLVSDDAKDASVFDPLVPQLINSPAEKRFPLTAFLVTLFPGKGISTGITYNHVVSDGRSILHFIKTWASNCQSLQGTNNSMVHDSLLLQPPCINKALVKEEPNDKTESAISNFLKKTNVTRDTFYISNHDLNHHLVAGTDKVFATFVMGRAEIDRLKQCVLANKKGNSPPFHLSTFVLTCAYVWVCSIKAQYRESGAAGSEEDQMEYFLFVVDCRTRLDPPLPVTYFGACLRPTVAAAKASDLMGEHGVAIAAERIGNAIREIEDGKAILKYMEWFLSYILTLPRRILSVAGSTKFGTYDVDFGWGKPKKNRVVSIATTGALSLSECPSEVGAVEVGLARDKVEMGAFAFLFESTIQGFKNLL